MKAEPAFVTPQNQAIVHDERENLLPSLRRLPDAQADGIALAFYCKLSHSERAERLDLPTGSVKSRRAPGAREAASRDEPSRPNLIGGA
jgi:DNA-directed RNA polymerase specialized sigma24 family protein